MPVFLNNPKLALENDCKVVEVRKVDNLPVENQSYFNLETPYLDLDNGSDEQVFTCPL